MARVLVIDDDVTTCKLIRSVLEDLGCEVDLAHDGREGLERFARGGFSLVVCDLFLPEVMGYDVCRQIRAHDRDTPILSMSGMCLDARSAANLGIPVYGTDFIPKPIDIDTLAAKASTLLGARPAVSAEPGEPRLVFGATEPQGDAESRERWAGTLATALVDTFTQRRSGSLALTHGDITVEVACASGFPVDVSAPFRRENLGRFLLREARMTEEEHQQALRVAVERRRPLEEVLVELGFVEAQELAALERAHKRESLVGAFAWGAGRVDFAEGRPLTTAATAQLNPSSVVLDGVRRAFPEEALRSRYEERAEHVLRAGPRFQAAYTLFAPFLYRTGLHAALGTATTVAMALRTASGPREQVLAILRALELLDVVRVVSAGEAAHTLPQEPPRAEDPPDARPASHSRDAAVPAGDEAVAPTARTTADTTAVTPHAPPHLAALDRARQTHEGEHPGSTVGDAGAFLRSAAAAVPVAHGAPHPLGPARDAPSTDATAPALDAQHVRRQLAAVQGDTHYATLGVAPDADDPTLRAAFLERLASVRPDRAGLPAALVAACEEATVRLAAAFGVLVDPELRRRYDALVRGEPRPAGVGAGAPRAEAASPPPPRAAETPLERYLREGRAALDRGDYATALHAFEAARRQRPDAAELHLFAGVARYRSNPRDPNNIQESVRDIQRASELEETDAAYYQLGQIFREQGLSHKAKQMFGRALGMNPDNSEARRALEALGGVAA